MCACMRARLRPATNARRPEELLEQELCEEVVMGDESSIAGDQQVPAVEVSALSAEAGGGIMVLNTPPGAQSGHGAGQVCLGNEQMQQQSARTLSVLPLGGVGPMVVRASGWTLA